MMSQHDTTPHPRNNAPKVSALWGREYPTCPHCEHEETEWWDGSPEWKGREEREIECGVCNHTYTAILHEVAQFDCAPKEASNV